MGAIWDYLTDPRNLKDIKGVDLKWYQTLLPWLVQQGAPTVARYVAAHAAVFAGLAGVAALVGVGSLIYWLTPDSPIKAGEKGDKNARIAANTVTNRRGPVAPGDDVAKYFVYVLKISGGSVWIGQEFARAKSRRCDFGGGGLCEGDGLLPPEIEWQSKDAYDTLGDATTAWCAELKGKNTENWTATTGDRKADVYGGKYWIGLAPGCN